MRIFATLTAAAALAAALLTSASASAAESAQQAGCPNGPNNPGKDVSVSIVNNDCWVTQIRGAINTSPAEGHFRFWGPNGDLGVSETKTWDLLQVATKPVNQNTQPGHLWCVAFIRSNGGQLGGNTCLTV